jgi:formate-dependent nitrite reductase membrane component NrfD
MARGIPAGGPSTIRSGAGRAYRGSKKRLQRITFDGNWSTEFWVVVVIVALAILVLIPLMVSRHGSD